MSDANDNWDNRDRPPSPWELERRIALLEASHLAIREELHKINANTSRLVWIVLGAVALAVINTVLKGSPL